ncbi:hypothetical protein EDC94DRAFT_119699 [Helicostylum pulchrum]|nr:hypothetical protein EDC94DRAFT_119699 [Helicostylum pulchrum]
MPVMIKRFSLVSNESELMNIPVIVEALGFVKDKFVGFEAKYKGRNRAMNEDIKKWMKPSFNTEVRK